MIYEIKFSHGEQNIFAQSKTLYEVRKDVIVQSKKGKTHGKIVRVLPSDTLIETDFQLVRAVEEGDWARINEVEALSQSAKKKVRELIEQNGLEMKVVEVAYNLEQSQLFISFTAENRVDFRNLLKELAATFRARIDLRQIGSRDAAKVYGGIGPCGRPLCCAEFIYEFPNVSIKMAKNQTLSLKQSKLNGLCGRLMCCLTYEDDFYREAQRKFPDFGETVQTQDGAGRVIALNILSNKVTLRYENMIKEIDVAEIEVKRG